MNENLVRWVAISVAKHFESVAAGLSLPYLVEGITERTEALIRADHVELRLTGPFVKEVSKNFYTIEVAVNALFTMLLDMAGADAYRLHRWTGKFQSVMLEPIPVYKYGSGVGDDDSLVFCLVPKKNSADAVRVYHFGQLDKDNRVNQSEVDALYGATYSP